MTSPFVVEPQVRSVLPDALKPFREQLADPAVTDLFVNGEHGLFVDRGSGSCRVVGWRASEREVRALAAALVAAGGRHVDDANPCVDVRLDGGIRVHVVLSPVSTCGTAVSIRVPRLGVPRLSDLRDRGSIDGATERFLRDAVARRANFLVSGAAGVGKTTLLAALIGQARPSERIVTVEDVAEIRLEHPHHVALEARQANLEGAGAIGLAQLVREALRMRPDRLVVGECRGAEVREMLTALNTGHDGGAGTVHANSLADVPVRLEALGALAGLDDTGLARQVASAIEFVVHLERAPDGTRRVDAIGRFRIVDGRLRADPVHLAPATERAGTGAPVGTQSRRARRRTDALSGPDAAAAGDVLVHAEPTQAPGRPGDAQSSPWPALTEAAPVVSAAAGDVCAASRRPSHAAMPSPAAGVPVVALTEPGVAVPTTEAPAVTVATVDTPARLAPAFPVATQRASARSGPVQPVPGAPRALFVPSRPASRASIDAGEATDACVVGADTSTTPAHVSAILSAWPEPERFARLTFVPTRHASEGSAHASAA